MTSTQQAGLSGRMKRRPLPCVLECSARMLLEDQPGGDGFVPKIVLKVDHTDFDHADEAVEVFIGSDQALDLATELLIAVRDRLEVKECTHILGECSNG